MDALLALEDGRVFHGLAFGAVGERTGEVVFNTSLTGYQEVLTDPSYKGQIVVMTNPHIGNYGVTPEDDESCRPFVEAFVVREVSPLVSNWRAQGDLSTFLKTYGVMGITELDTRALVRHIRSRGAMRGVLSATDPDADRLVTKARQSPSMEGLDLVQAVTCDAPYEWTEGPLAGWQVLDRDLAGVQRHVVAYDFGIKHNILRLLADRGCRVTVVPATTSAYEVLAMQPDGVFLSNGPGDPAAVTYAVESIAELLGQVPIFGICLGHQLLALALGGQTYKLKFGHRGGNQPVKNLRTGRVEITAHNHGFAVAADSLPPEVEVTHVNLNDGCVEGLRHRELPAFSVQYHPEASPGPHDARYLFDRFVEMIKKVMGDELTSG